MNKYARFNIALAVNMKIVTPAGNTATYKFTVVLEINGKNRLTGFTVSVFTNGTVNMLPLFRR